MPTGDDFLTNIESDVRWNAHHDFHELLERADKEELNSLNRRLDTLIQAHQQIHTIHEKAHEREHEMTSTALSKAEQSMDRRLEAMNAFREELNRQASTFLTREVFDKYQKDLENKMELALAAMTDKNETLHQSLINRHDSDFNSLRETIQNEKEIRKTFEGSMSTWKWIASFLGASGVAGVILLFATRT